MNREFLSLTIQNNHISKTWCDWFTLKKYGSMNVRSPVRQNCVSSSCCFYSWSITVWNCVRTECDTRSVHVKSDLKGHDLWHHKQLSKPALFMPFSTIFIFSWYRKSCVICCIRLTEVQWYSIGVTRDKVSGPLFLYFAHEGLWKVTCILFADDNWLMNWFDQTISEFKHDQVPRLW